ncbi:MAG: AAA family ATPase [Paracoccaceae bacterium]|nr:AAA family ATPase [Paracoccaceae bacterium]
MKRVMVLGGPGSGKSTLAVTLGRATGLPVIHMDKIHWQPGWVERSRPEKVRLVSEAEDREQWIIEGGLSVTYDNRAARADTVIWLDLPLPLRLFRVLKRRWRYRGGKTRPDLPDNCPERLDPAFLHWILFMGRQNREKIAKALDRAQHLTVYHLKSRRDVKAFLSSLTA